MTRAITVLLDEQDYTCVSREARQLGVNPGAAARALIHAAIQSAEKARSTTLRSSAPDAERSASRVSTPAQALPHS